MKKATDEQILESYMRLNNIWYVAEELCDEIGMTKSSICRFARKEGLTNRRSKNNYVNQIKEDVDGQRPLS